MTNEFAEQKTMAKVRVEYANKAGASPDHFMNSAGTTVSKVQYFVKKALADGHIDTASKKGYATWSNSDVVVCEIPFGKKPFEALTDFSMSKTKEASQFLDRVKTLLSA
jgi:hypothetical protein